MPKSLTDMGVRELEKMLNQRKEEILELARERDALRSKLEAVEARLETLGGTAGSAAPRASKPVKTVRRPRVKNSKSLHAIVTEVLAKNPLGLVAGEIQKKVLETGYRSKSKNFGNVLYQCLYNNPKSFRRDKKTGAYKNVAQSSSTPSPAKSPVAPKKGPAAAAKKTAAPKKNLPRKTKKKS